MRTRLQPGSVTWSRLLTSQGLPLGKGCSPLALYSSRLSSLQEPPSSELTILSAGPAPASTCRHFSQKACLLTLTSLPHHPLPPGPRSLTSTHPPRRLCEVTGDLHPCHQLRGQF